MPWFLYKLSDGSIDSAITVDEPTPGEGQAAIETPIGYPDSYIWSPENKAFTAVPPAQIVSRVRYQLFFTQEERIAIRSSTDPIVIDLRELASLADSIDLGDPVVAQGLVYLTANNYIAAGRKTMILEGIIPDALPPT